MDNTSNRSAIPGGVDPDRPIWGEGITTASCHTVGLGPTVAGRDGLLPAREAPGIGRNTSRETEVALQAALHLQVPLLVPLLVPLMQTEAAPPWLAHETGVWPPRPVASVPGDVPPWTSARRLLSVAAATAPVPSGARRIVDCH